MSREPIRDLMGRQYGETVRGAHVRYLSGEKISSVEYLGESNEAVFLAFARDIEKGKYDGRLIYSVHTAMAPDEMNTLMWVYFLEGNEDYYMWGQERRA